MKADFVENTHFSGFIIVRCSTEFYLCQNYIYINIIISSALCLSVYGFKVHANLSDNVNAMAVDRLADEREKILYAFVFRNLYRWSQTYCFRYIRRSL